MRFPYWPELRQSALGPIVAFLAAAFIVFLGATIARADMPNVLVVQADDLRIGSSTPDLVAIAAQGVTLTEMHGAAMCSPVRTDVQTSRWHERFGINNALAWNTTNIGIGDVPSLPRYMASLGYHTALFGKWHLGILPKYSPLNHYQVFKGALGGEIDQFTHKNKGGEIDWWNGATRDTSIGYTTSVITDDAMQYISETPGPWFVYVAYTATHVPNQAPDGTVSLDKQRAALDQDASALMSAVPPGTIIIFVGDNGMGGTGLKGNKGGVWEGGLRIPAFVRWDGHIAPHQTVARVASALDIAPTIAELIGQPLTIPTDGVSFAPAITGRPWGAARELFYSNPNGGVFAEYLNPWKLYWPVGQLPQLYNLQSDPGETKNVAGANPTVVAARKAHVTAWRATVGR